jgi:hypothetical protein
MHGSGIFIGMFAMVSASLLVAGCNDNAPQAKNAALSRAGDRPPQAKNAAFLPKVRDDRADCDNSSLPTYQVLAACNRVIEETVRIKPVQAA